MIACLGGGCQSRNACQTFHEGYGKSNVSEDRLQLVERLCGKTEEPAPMIRMELKQDNQWEKKNV